MDEILIEKRAQARAKVEHLEKCLTGFQKALASAKVELEKFNEAAKASTVAMQEHPGFVSNTPATPSGKPPLPKSNPFASAPKWGAPPAK